MYKHQKRTTYSSGLCPKALPCCKSRSISKCSLDLNFSQLCDASHKNISYFLFFHSQLPLLIRNQIFQILLSDVSICSILKFDTKYEQYLQIKKLYYIQTNRREEKAYAENQHQKLCTSSHDLHYFANITRLVCLLFWLVIFLDFFNCLCFILM